MTSGYVFAALVLLGLLLLAGWPAFGLPAFRGEREGEESDSGGG